MDDDPFRILQKKLGPECMEKLLEQIGTGPAASASANAAEITTLLDTAFIVNDRYRGDWAGTLRRGDDLRSKDVAGVSLQDAALALRPGDPDGQRELVRRWQNSRDPRLPQPIGKSPEHSQRNLYEPTSILAFLETVEGSEVGTDFGLNALFRKLSRLPR